MEEKFQFEVIKQELPVIEFNYEELKSEIKAFADKRKDMAVTDENLNESKKIQKELASVRRKVDDARKKVKKIMSAPIKEAEEKFKELIGLITDVEIPLKEGLAVFEEIRREEKREKVRDLILEVIKECELDAIFSKKMEILDRYLNVSTSFKAIKEDLDIKALELKNLQNVEKENRAWIESQVSQASEIFGVVMKPEQYVKKYDRGIPMNQISDDIMLDGKNLLEAKEKAERDTAEKARIKAEADAAAKYAEQHQEEEVEEHNIEVPEIIKDGKIYNAKTGEYLRDSENLFQEQEADVVAKVVIEKEEVPFYEMVFKITTTYDVLEKLKEFFEQYQVDQEVVDFKEVE